MARTAICFVLLLQLIVACRHDAKNQYDQPPVNNSNFFPVLDFLKSEIHYVDSLPLGITQYHTANGRTDTAYIQAAAFNILAQQFVPSQLEPSFFTRSFSETSFMDQTMQLVTFTYAAKHPEDTVKRIDVLANPSGGNNQVKSIYLEKRYDSSNVRIVQKMYWKARRNFLVVTTRQASGKSALVDQLKVVWDNRD